LIKVANKDNYPKAIAVYEAVLGLIRDGRDVSALTVSDIARAAGIGKGTTYDYFSSKDEIIAKSLIYGYKQLLGQILDEIDKAKTLKEKIQILTEIAVRHRHVGNAIETITEMISSSKEMKNHIRSVFESEHTGRMYLGKIIDHLIAAAVSEGLCETDADKSYGSFVILSMLQMVFGPVSCVLAREGYAAPETQGRYLYMMIQGALAQK